MSAKQQTSPALLPKVYWDERHRVFFGKFKRSGAWKNKVVPVNIEGPEAAQEWFGRWLKQYEATGVAPTNEEVRIEARKTIRTLAPRWLAWKRATAPSEKTAYANAERLLEMWVFPHRIADIDIETELSLGDCTEWLEWVKSAKRSSNTNRNILQGLRGFLVDVRGKGWAKFRENPLLDPYIRKVLGPIDTIAGKNTIIHLKKAEVAQFVGCTAADIPAIRKVRNLLAIATGCRLGEIAALRWDDLALDGEQPAVKVFRQYQRSYKVHVFKDPKKKSHRIIPLHPTAVKALRWWKDAGWKEYVGRAPNGADPVFSTPSGDYGIARWASLLRTDLAVSKLPTLFEGKHPITFHALRRTFMSLLEGEGVSRDLISALAGHSGKSVADRHYIAKNIERFAKVVALLPLPEDLPHA